MTRGLAHCYSYRRILFLVPYRPASSVASPGHVPQYLTVSPIVRPRVPNHARFSRFAPLRRIPTLALVLLGV